MQNTFNSQCTIANQTLYYILVITFNTLCSKMVPNMQCPMAIHRHLWKSLAQLL